MNSELRNRILFTLFILFLYRIGTFIPLPGVDSSIIQQFFSSKTGTIFGIINVFSGGALARMSIFALNIMPYITASIVVQLLGSVYKELEELRKEGEYGRKKINQYTKYLTLFLSFFQSIGIYFAFKNLEQSAFISDSQIFLWTTVFSLIAGTMILMWLGDRITAQGIGNGISLIIFVGIVSDLPTSFMNVLDLSKRGVYSWFTVILFIAFLILFMVFITFIELITRRVRIQYPNRGVMKSSGMNDSSYIPLKLNVSGVIPPIFASSVLMFPVAISHFLKGEIGNKISMFLQRGDAVYFISYSLLLIFFCFFYAALVFNAEEIAENLKKSNAFIPGVRPGKSTEEYFKAVISRITMIGSLYLLVVCIVPEILISKYAVPLSVGGTGLLIIVNVITELVAQIQSYLFTEKYSNINKRRRIKIRQ
jgi:preprotein translocase subunit SecY